MQRLPPCPRRGHLDTRLRPAERDRRRRHAAMRPHRARRVRYVRVRSCSAFERPPCVKPKVSSSSCAFAIRSLASPRSIHPAAASSRTRRRRRRRAARRSKRPACACASIPRSYSSIATRSRGPASTTTASPTTSPRAPAEEPPGALPKVVDADYNLGAVWLPTREALDALAVHPAIASAVTRLLERARG